MISKFRKFRLNPLLLKVLIISGLVHVVAILVLGGITIVKYVISEDVAFEEPPAVEQEEPPPDVKIDINPRQPPQDQPLQNLRMKQVGNIAVAQVDVDLPEMGESFTVDAGLGNFSGGNMLGGAGGRIGLGMSEINVFGLKARAEKVIFLIDSSAQMVLDNKGGLNSYRVIKDEISSMVSSLAPGTLFNALVYDQNRALKFSPNLLPASDQNKERFKAWLNPVNASANAIGLPNAPHTRISTFPEELAHKSLYEFSNADNADLLHVQAALEQQVDAVFMITGSFEGFSRMRRLPNERELAEWKKKESSPAYQKALADFNGEVPEMQKKVAEALARINAERKQKGMPPRVLPGGIVGQSFELRLKWNNPHPGFPPGYFMDDNDLRSYFKKLEDELYGKTGMEGPSVNVVLLLAGDENFSSEMERNIDAFTRAFKGKTKIVRGLNEIKDAATAAEKGK